MGGSSYSDDHYTDRVAYRKAHDIPAFKHDDDIRTGKSAAKCHDKLNPKGVVRESRDSDAHPASNAIAVVFDDTGSMGGIPKVLQSKIPQLMGLLLRKGYIDHPQVLFASVGDYSTDVAPLQVGQFESGIEMDDDITNLYLEGQGGGSNQESYELALYFFAHKTSLDCLEKRGKKGYLFVIGDECPYAAASQSQLAKVLGETVQQDVKTEDVVEAAKQKYEIFFLIPRGASNTDAKWLRDRWGEFLGPQHVILLQDPAAVCETIASVIGVCEGTVDSVDKLASDLKDIGADDHTTATVGAALDPLVKSTALARAGSGDLPEVAQKPATNVRL